MESLKKDLFQFRYGILIAFIYIIVMELVFHMTCPFLAFFNFPCPACGLSRAVICLFTFRFKKSLYYNKSAIFWLITIGLFLIDRYFYSLKLKPFPTLFIITSIVTLIVYIF